MKLKYSENVDTEIHQTDKINTNIPSSLALIR